MLCLRPRGHPPYILIEYFYFELEKLAWIISTIDHVEDCILPITSLTLDIKSCHKRCPRLVSIIRILNILFC
jgi:hypothetical protein